MPVLREVGNFCNALLKLYRLTDVCKAPSIQEIEATASYRTFPPVGAYFVVGRYTYSHVLFLKPRLVAFSEMARLMWSETPSGKSAVISTLTFTVA